MKNDPDEAPDHGAAQKVSSNQSDDSVTLGAQIMVASELGSVFALCVILGYFGGNWLDGAMKWQPYGVVTGLMVGMGIGLALVVKRSSDLDKRSSRTSGDS
ncbi:MAG: AtpZ/AtpI family protein [Cyanobacteria bacterium REEB67]|nr:AtpZ/AtpI family protein [Cyanobacteria bacterium REEB67]